MFANNFKSASPNQTLVVHNQEQDQEEGHLSDSEDMVNLGELIAEQRLEIVELRRFQEERRLEIVGLHQQHHAEIARLHQRHLEITELHQQHHAEIARLHEERHFEITGPRLEINEGHLSDSEDMVNLGELTAEQRLEIVGLHQQRHAEITRLHEERHLEITELRQQHRAEIARLHLTIIRLHREHHVEITGLSTPEILLAATVAAILLVFAAGLLGTF
ncbi:hypothetical protein H4I96_09403 [Botrytis cinerea]